ncbi:hypothetical protein Tco_0449768 [Tanacetum coccineum]
MGSGTQQPEEPEPTLEDEFQDLHLNVPVLKVLAHALIYNAMLDKYVESLEPDKNGSTFVQREVSAKMEDPRLNPPPTSNRPVQPTALRAQAIQELYELQRISAFVDSRLESIERFLNNFANQPNETNMNDLESDDESVDTPLVSPFPHSDNDSDDGEVLNELIEYENVGMLPREKAINSFDGDDLAFQYMIGFRKSVAYFDPFLPMNIITRKAYNTIMVEGLESTRKNLVAVVRDVYVFVGSFTYITDFVVIFDEKKLGSRKAYLLKTNANPKCMGYLMRFFSTWMTFGGNTHDLGSFGEETDKITDLHQIHEEVLFTERGDGVAGIKRRRRDLSSDGVRDLATASGRGRLKEDLESST